MSHTPIALLFPGQGSQEMNMGRALAEADADIMNLWKKAERRCSIALREIYWDNGSAAQPGLMDNTKNLQPALTVTNLSFWIALSRRFKPACTAGHSLGEYSALAAAEVLNVDDVLQLVALRGRLMAEADTSGKGSMAAIVKLDLPGAQSIVQQAAATAGENLRIANYNTPTQFVASGGKNAVAALQEIAKEFKGRAIPLAVSGAFHSPLMQEAAQEMSIALHKAAWNTPRFPVYCNVSGKACRDAQGIKEQVLRQMTASVMWTDTMQEQYKDGARTFVECGPKNVLTKMVAPNLAGLAEEGSYTAITTDTALQS